MTRKKKIDESGGNVLGYCEYAAGGTECDRKAVTQINGWALCSHHKRYGETMEFRGAGKPDDSAKIEEHNAETAFRNEGVADHAFTPYTVYNEHC